MLESKNLAFVTKEYESYTKDYKQEIGEQKIDIVLNLKHSDVQLPICTVAKDEGIQILEAVQQINI